jgi:hypothetical protein
MTEYSMMLPNFIIVGAPKAGTTSLYHYLSEHPQVFMSDPKEVNFFSAKEILAQSLYYKASIIHDEGDYQSLFKDADGKKAIGEGSVSYLFYPETPYRIKQTLPDVKIIILLRNPVERAFSHYLMDYRMGLVDISFEDIVYKKGVDKNLLLFYQQHIELGLYYEQVKRYLDIFGKKQVKVYLQDDLRCKGDAVIQDLYQFLGINDSYFPDVNREHNSFSMPRNKIIHRLYASVFVRSVVAFFFRDALKEKVKGMLFERKKKPELMLATKEYLHEFYHDDVKKLEKLIGQDLSSWSKQ